MNQDFAQSRWFYLESAKLRRKREWTMICLGNVKRILDKEKQPLVMVAIESTDEEWFLGWEQV